MSSNLILTTPTQDELTEIWTSSHPSWGAALSLQGYIERENRQVDIPLARNGGLSRWILTDESGLGPRPVLSSLETLKKRGLVRDPASGVREVTVHGVASVFTDDKFRRKGYAGAMMNLLGEALQAKENNLAGDAHFSILYSDIGKAFYAKSGWKPFESSHLEFPASSTATTSSANLKTIGPDDLPSLAEADEALLRKKLADTPPSSKALVAVLPELDQFLWHTTRESLQCEQLLSRKPATHGVVYTSPTSPSSRVWAIWKRNHSGLTSQPEKNTLFILRFVVENESMGDEELSSAIEAIVTAARKEAAEWACGKVEMWNPSDRVRRLSEKNDQLGAKYVVRESDSISSLRWHGAGSVDDVEWIANEKYAWC